MTQRGALVIAVTDNVTAEDLATLLDLPVRADDEGVRVIPFGASALAFSGPGSHLFRGLIAITPRGGPISPQTFQAWIENSISPYMAPGARRIVL